ncbi:MAG: B12-binding domain-containing protein [Anaerolineales bacterium]
MLTDTVLALREQSVSLAEEISRLHYARQGRFWNPYGDTGWQKSMRDITYHLMYLIEAIEADDAGLFTEYVAWVHGLFQGLHFPEDTLRITLECMQTALKQYPQAQPILLAALQVLETPLTDTILFVQPQSRLGELAQTYLNYLLSGKRYLASELILEAARNGTPIPDLYLNVFQPVQREIGRLWHANQISVAREHYCTAATQMIMSQLYPYIFGGERKGPHVVVACVGGELHEIGARMVADFFEMHGWNTTFLGANTPVSEVLHAMQLWNAQLLALSVTMTFHVGQARDLIRQLRTSPVLAHLPVMVGGYPFNLAPDLWRTIGADGYSYDASGAITEAQRLLNL